MSTSRGRIVKVLYGTPTRWVVNLGAEHLSTGDEVVIFELGEEIVDPSDGSSLGELELVKCHAVVDHAQEKLAVLSAKGAAEPVTRSRVLSAVLADTGSDSSRGSSGKAGTIVVQVGDSARKV